MALSKEQQERLDALRGEQKAWDAADRDRAELAELEQLEQEKRVRDLVAELEPKLGKRSVHFEVIDTLAGPVAVKLGEGIVYMKFLDALNSDGGLHLADMQDFILPNLAAPSRDEYVKMCTTHAGLPLQVWPELSKLYRAQKDRQAGK